MNNNLPVSKISKPSRMLMRQTINFDNTSDSNNTENVVPINPHKPTRKENMSRMSSSLNPDFM